MKTIRFVIIHLVTGLIILPFSASAAENLVTNPGFESSSLSPWSAFNGGTASSSTSDPYLGSKAGRSSARTNSNRGLQQSLISQVQPGRDYLVSAWVRTDSTTSQTVTVGVQKTEDSITSLTPVATVSVTNSWQQIKGIYPFNVTGNLTNLSLYFNGPASGVELFVDEVSVNEEIIAIENLLNNPNFEDGTSGWSPHGSATISPTSMPHTGIGASSVTNRTAAWHGISQSVLGKTEGGRIYYGAGWVKTDNTTPNTVKLTMQVIDNGVTTFHGISTGQASSASWTWLSGYVTLPLSSSGLSDVRFFVEGPAIGVGMTIDNCYFAPVTGLRRAASAYPGLRLGAGGMRIDNFTDSPKFAAALGAHFHYASPGNSLKFQPSEPTNDNFKFDEGEAIIDFGIAHGGSSRGHVFVWHDQVSSFAQDTTDPVALRTILWDNIDTKAAHFRGRLPHWDVVNEAIVDGTSGALRSTLWYNAPGIGYAASGNQYIRESFIRAHAADPEALLVYNDYATDTVNPKSTAVYTMLQNFVNAGVPIDAVGFQAHLDSRSSPSLSSVRNNFQRFQDLGLDIHVTELDYKLPVDANGIATPANLTAQGDDYFDYTSAALGYSRLKLFQTWGIYDGSSWIPGHTNGESGQALPLDFNFNRKPAYWGMWNALAGQCEKLALVEVSAGDSHTVVTNNTRLGGNGGRRLNADGPNDFITLLAHVPFAGQWSVKVGALKLASGGRFQLSVAAPGSTTFTNVGSVQDTYAASDAAAALTIGNHNFATTGDWQFRFTASGKNASATDHNLTLDFIRLTPVSCSPAISVVQNQSIEVNGTLPPVLFLAEDDFAQGSLQVTASSSNPSLLPSSAIVVTGESPYYRVAASPLANQSGATVITLTASDGTLTTTRSFTLSVGVESATVTLGNLAAIFTGGQINASATTVPPGLAVDLTYNGSTNPPTNAGSYAVVGTVNDANYQGASSGTLVISKAPATVTLGNLVSQYDGNPKPASATTMPPGLAVDLTYNGSITAPSVAGSYAVVATINDANYQGTASGTLAISLLADQHRYLDWQFNETNGTQLNSTVNSGTRTVVDNTLNPPKPTWNFGLLKTQDGVINIGDTQDQKWNPNSTSNGGSGGATGHTFRTANLTAPITGGNIVFEYKIANWNLAGTDGLGSTNNGIGFRVGEVVGSVFNAVNLEFEVSQDTNDIRVQSSTLGSGLTGTAPVSTSVINATALVSGRLYRISAAGDTNWTLIGAANNNVDTLFTATAAGTGTGTAIELTSLPSNQLGDVNLVGSTTNAVTVQLLANLDTGVWSSRAKVGTSGPWLPLTTDGTGLTQIDRIQLVIDARNGTGWQYGGVPGTATEFVQIDSVTLGAPVTPAVDFANTQLTADLSQGQTDLPFSLNTPKLSSSATYTGQPLFGALKLQPVGSLATNGASLSFASTGGMKVEWSGTQGESEAGRYAENDVATGVFVVRRQEFLNGLNTQTVSFNSENDTLAANVVLQHQQGRVKSGRFRWVVKDSGNFYISNQVGSELTPAQTPNNNPVTLTSEALSLTWNSYNPWDLNHLNPASFTPVATPAFANIQAIGVWLSATAGANPGLTNQAQGLQVTSLAALAFGATAAVADTVPPVIALIGDPSVSVAVGASYADAGATATDAVDGTVDLTTTNPVNTAVAGVYTITYNASDTSGNPATPVTRTVNVTAGGFSSWITGTFAGSATVPPDKQGPNDDPDGDSISNLVEYAIIGQDPTVPNPTAGSFTGSVLSYTKRADTSGLTYAIEESTGLVGWTEVSGGSYVNNTTTISYTLIPGSPEKNFLRLRVTSN